MQKFTGWEYLLIDVANQFGKDKLLFNERIEWATQNLQNLEALSSEAEKVPLYLKAVQAVRKAQKGLPTGHLVGFDACCSGIQIMSTVTGCIAGATNTGLVDPDVRADAYTKTTDVMNNILGSGLVVSRANAKRGLMTSFYASEAVPVEIFGKDTPELDAFFEAAMIVAPGAWELLQDLLAAWQPYALVHAWKLPDGYDARVKVMTKIEPSPRIEVDELDHATFTYEVYDNIGTKKGKSLVANVVHSLDAYVLRSIHRRCNYDLGTMTQAREALCSEADLRSQGYTVQVDRPMDGSKLDYYIEQYERCGIPDITILSHIEDGHQTQYLSSKHVCQLLHTVNGMLEYRPFEVVTIHDEFKCHPNNMNHLRQQYINVFVELADSEVLTDLFQQITGEQGTYPKLSNNLGDLIKGSNYALS